MNVVCELARKNPKNYLSLAPMFFKLMTTSTNNWMLIKIIKLVSYLLQKVLHIVFRADFIPMSNAQVAKSWSHKMVTYLSNPRKNLNLNQDFRESLGSILNRHTLTLLM